MNLFYLTELSLIKKSPHCGSVLRNSRFRCSHWAVKKITLLFQTIKSFSSSTLFSSLFPSCHLSMEWWWGFMEDWGRSGGGGGANIPAPIFLLCPQFNLLPPQHATSPSWLEGIGWNSPVHVLSSCHWVYPCREHTVSSLSWNYTPSCSLTNTVSTFKPFRRSFENSRSCLRSSNCYEAFSSWYVWRDVSDTSLSKRFIMLLLWFCSVRSISANDTQAHFFSEFQTGRVSQLLLLFLFHSTYLKFLSSYSYLGSRLNLRNVINSKG